MNELLHQTLQTYRDTAITGAAVVYCFLMLMSLLGNFRQWNTQRRFLKSEGVKKGGKKK